MPPTAAAAASAPKLPGKAGIVDERLQVLNRLASESVALLDVLGGSLAQLSAVTAPIHSRATALTAAQRNIGSAKESVDKLLEHLDTSRRVQPILEAGPVCNLDGFLDCLTQLEASNDFLVAHGSLAAVRAALEHSQSVFNKALEACDGDFRASLSAGSRSSMPDAVWLTQAVAALGQGTEPSSLVKDLVPARLLPKLRHMVELMLEAEYAPAQEGYISSRSRAIQQVFIDAKLELPVSSRPGLLPPEQLEHFMGSWGQQLSTLAVMLMSEQKLADDIWPPPLNGRLFGQLAQPFLASLVAAGHDIVEARKAPDKLFSLLDMHVQISLALPLISKMLTPPQPAPNSRRSSGTGSATGSAPQSLGGAGAAGTALVDGLWELQQLVAGSALVLFNEYEGLVSRDGNKMLPGDGTIHPLTAQVLSYVKRLLTYKSVASILYGRQHHPGRPLSPSADEEENQGIEGDGAYSYYDTPAAGDGAAGGGSSNEGRARPLSKAEAGLSAGLARLLMKLLDNLEVKARGYKNEALAALFVMNNVHYIQWSVESSPAALHLLGVAWLERHKDVVEDWGAAYHDATWMPLVNMLRADPPADPVRLKQVLKDTYNSFNAAIESIYTSQSGWTIPDHMLRGAVKRVIKDDLLNTYQDFLRRHADVQFTNNPAKYIKYAAADVSSIIDDDLFETKAVSMNKLSLNKEKLGAIV